MTEIISNTESIEMLPSEDVVFSAIQEICGDHAFVETNRSEQGGKLRLLEIRLTEPTAEGLLIQLDYTVNRKGVATVDVAYLIKQLVSIIVPGQGTSQ